jgi:Ni,Fe-hydrogenase I cytochrome b subunit
VAEHLVHNERVKLVANLFNGLATVSIATAVIQNLFLLATSPGSGFGANPSVFLFFLIVGICLHGIGLYILGSLTETPKEISK